MMKVLNKFVIVLFAIIFMVSNASAQAISQEEMMKNRAAEKVAQMNDYISFMASKKKNGEDRKYYKKKALNLFIANGNSYEENGKEKDGVMIEIISPNRKFATHQLIRDFFSHLTNLQYTDIKITSTDVVNIKVSNLQQIDDSMYVCTCQYDLVFVGYCDGHPVYKDITTKRVKFYISAYEADYGMEYLIKLGDVYATQILRQ